MSFYEIVFVHLDTNYDLKKFGIDGIGFNYRYTGRYPVNNAYDFISVFRYKNIVVLIHIPGKSLHDRAIFVKESDFLRIVENQHERIKNAYR